MSWLKSFILSAFAISLAVNSANAQNVFTWTGATSNSWNAAGNWTDTGFTGTSPGSVVLNPLDTANVATGTNLPITLTGTATVGVLNVDVAGFALNGTGNLKANLIDATGFGNITIGATLGDSTNGLANVAGTPTATNGTLEVRVDTGSSATLGPMISINNTFRSDTGTINYNGPITLSAPTSGTVTTFRSNTTASAVHNFNSAITGTGSVTYSGAGTWNHNVANSYTGSTVLGTNSPNASSIHVINNDLAFSTGTLTFTGGTNLQTVQGDGSGPRTLANRISLGRDAIFAGKDKFTLTGDIFQTNTRNLTNNISGNQLVVNGRVFAASDNTGRVFTFNGSGTTVLNNAFYDRYDSTTSSPVALAGAYGSLGYNGTGTLILGNSFVGNNTGWTEVRQGTLQVGTGGATPTLGGVAISGGQTTTIGTMVFNHNDNIIAKPMNLLLNVTNTGGGNLTFNGPSFGGGTITSTGGGTIFVNGGNWAGSTITDAARPGVNALVVTSAQASNYTIGQTLTVSGVTSANASFSFSNLFIVNKTDLGNGTFGIDLSGNIGNTAATANGYTVVADAGTGTGSRNVIANGGTISGSGVIGGNATAVNGGVIDGTLRINGTATASGTGTFGNTVVFNGSATATNNGKIIGNQTIAGNATADSGGLIGGTRAINGNAVANGGTISGTITIGGNALATNGGLIDGSTTINGTATVSGTGAFGNSVIFNGGVTATNNGSLIGNQTVAGNATADSGGLIGGTRLINGNLVIAAATTGTNPTAAGIVAPGASIGTVTVNGNGNISGVMNIEFDGAAAQKLDLLNFGGNLTLDSTSVLNLQQLGTILDGTTPFTFVNYGGTLTGTFGTVNYGALAGLYTVDYAFNGGHSIAIVAVPEPSTIALVGIGLAGVLVSQRRRIAKLVRK